MTIYPRTHLRIIGKSISAYTAFGVAGFSFGLIYAIILNATFGLALWYPPVMFLISIAGFFTLTWITKTIKGKDSIVYYYHMVLFFVLSGLLLYFTGQDLTRGLDTCGLAFGVFTVLGRLGCFMVGCCHGIPHEKGVSYHESHRKSGFPVYLLGIPLLPVQIYESALTGLAVVTGTLAVFVFDISGIGVSIFLLSYFFSRFFLEFFRGDNNRSYFFGFSEAQWASVILSLLAGLAAYNGILPYFVPFFLLAAILLLQMSMIGLSHFGYSKTYRVLGDPSKVKELISLAESSFAANVISSDGICHPETKAIRCSSWGLIISADRLMKEKNIYTLYSFSAPCNEIDFSTCEKIAMILRKINHRGQKWEIVEREIGVYHLLFQLG